MSELPLLALKRSSTSEASVVDLPLSLTFSPRSHEAFVPVNAGSIKGLECAAENATVNFQCPPPCGHVPSDATRECGPRTVICCILCPFTGIGLIWSLTITGEFICRKLCCCNADYLCACDERRCKGGRQPTAPKPTEMAREMRSPLQLPPSPPSPSAETTKECIQECIQCVTCINCLA